MTRKKIILTTITCAALFSACKTDDSIGLDTSNGYVTSSNVKVTPNKVSAFDQGDTDYKLFSTVELVDKLNVNGETLSTKDKVSTFTADFTKLGLTKVGDKSELVIIPFIGNKELDTVRTKISVFNPIEIFTSVQSSKNKDSLVTKVEFTKNSTCEVLFKIKQPKNGTINNLIVERKVSEAGTYSTVAGSPFNVEKDSITFKSSDFNKLDEVYYRVTAKTSEGVTVSEETKVLVDTDYFGNALDAELSVSGQFYSLPKLEKSTSADADMEFVSTSSVFDLSIVSKKPEVTFVAYPGAGVKEFNFGDKLEAIKVFNTGSPVNQIKPLKPGEVYVYKKVIKETGKPDVDTYGLLLMGALSSDPESSIKVSIRS